MSSRTVFALLSSAAYMAFTRVCIESLRQQHPECPIHLLYFGDDTPDLPGVTIHRPEVVKPNQPPEHYPDADRIAAHRPAFLRYLMQDLEILRIVLLGSDCVLFDKINGFVDALGIETPALLTPHFTVPPPFDDKHPSYEDLLYTGHMNVDVVGLYSCPAIWDFLVWMDQALMTHCVRDKSRHIFSDQTWWHFLFDFVDGVKAWRDPAYNVGYWNVVDRGFCYHHWGTGTVAYVCGAPLRIFQFSGISMEDPAQMSTHQNRHRATGDLREFFEGYVERVRRYQ